MCSRAVGGFGVAAVLIALAACRAPGADHQAIQDAAEAHGGEVTVAGCLYQSEETGRLVLVNTILAHERAGFPVREGVPPPETLIGTTGTTGMIPATARGPRYTVAAPDEAGNLQEHTGRQVQVTGTLAARQDGPVAPTGDDGQRTAHDERDDADGHIQAQEIRIIAAACR